MVEIALGGIDYCNPDALCEKYAGEFQEFTDPREAAATGIAILKAWRNDGERKAKLAVGSTGGFTMPFEPTTIPQVLRWGREQYAALPKCPQCGELMNGESWKPADFYVDDDEACCSERCCEKRHLEPMEEAQP